MATTLTINNPAGPRTCQWWISLASLWRAIRRVSHIDAVLICPTNIFDKSFLVLDYPFRRKFSYLRVVTSKGPSVAPACYSV